MFDRYLNNPEATEESFLTDADGQRWFITGDQVIRSSEQDGSFQILGRLSQDIIKKSGYKISALELEQVILNHDSVSQCAVIGIPDEKYGEEIVAYVVMKAGQPADQEAEKMLNSHVKELVSSYKIPRIWKFVESLPRNQMGKVNKVEMKNEFK